MNQFQKVKNFELLNNKVYRLLKEEILKGSFKPGTKILEKEIANQLGISRTPVREAINKLNADGFVKINPNKGGYIVDFSIQDIEEIMQVRKVLEGFAAYVAVKKISNEEIIKLEKIIEKMKKVSTQGNILSYTELNRHFHHIILEIVGNKRLTKICNNLSGHEFKYVIKTLTFLDRLKYSIEEYVKILEALKERNSSEAKKMSILHIENVFKSISSCERKMKNKNQLS